MPRDVNLHMSFSLKFHFYVEKMSDDVIYYLGSMTSNDDPESTAEEREKEAPGFEMTNMPLHLQLYHSFLQVHIELPLYKFYISDIYIYCSSDILFLFL